MTFPAAVTVTFRPGASTTFINSLVLGDIDNGLLGVNVLGGSPEVAADITNDVQQIAIRRGRDRQFDTYNAGTATVQLIDLSGDWNPNNTESPYFGELKAGRQLRVSANYEGDDIFLFSGYITSYAWTFVKELAANFVTIVASDGTRILEQGTITTVADSAAGDTSSQRVNKILDQVLWPPSLRAVGSAGVLLQANPTERRSTLAAVRQVEEAELGALFVNALGVVTFRTRGEQAALAVAASTLFTDDPDPVGDVVRYQSLQVALDDQEIVNLVTANRIDGATQQATDPASIAEFFTRAREFRDLLNLTDLSVASLALQVVNYRSQPELEIKSVTVEMISDDETRLTAGLTLNIGDPIVVEHFAVGGTITSSLTVQGIQHNIGLSSWTTTFSTAEPLSLPFVLGSSLYGVLGTSIL